MVSSLNQRWYYGEDSGGVMFGALMAVFWLGQQWYFDWEICGLLVWIVMIYGWDRSGIMVRTVLVL
jgi:hypothetical protein